MKSSLIISLFHRSSLLCYNSSCQNPPPITILYTNFIEEQKRAYSQKPCLPMPRRTDVLNKYFRSESASCVRALFSYVSGRRWSAVSFVSLTVRFSKYRGKSVTAGNGEYGKQVRFASDMYSVCDESVVQWMQYAISL